MKTVGIQSLKNHTFLRFLFLWTLVNVYQAYTTEITGDEAYYVLFSEHLDWGYFDHPPMVALFIRVGRAIAGGALGVRLLAVLASSIGIAVMGSMIDRKDKIEMLVFMVLVGALPLFTVYGFIMTPDVPLLFFSSLFLWVVKRYLADDNRRNAVFLGILMAAILYSKYHGVLVMLFWVIAHPALFRMVSFYLASFLGFFLFLPHLWWQYEHGFVTFIYHLSGHSAADWHWGFVWEYLLYPVIVLSPLLAYFILKAMATYRANTSFEKMLLYLFWGVLGFFFLMSFKSHVEIHWIALIGLPVLLVVPAFYRDKASAKVVIRLGVVSAMLVFAMRILAVLPAVKEPRFHSNKAWAERIAEESEGQPVVFYGSYQWASLLAYYTPLESNSYNPYYYHNTQLDQWQMENKLRHKKVFFVSKQKQMGGKLFHTPKGEFYGYWIPDYYSLQGMKIDILSADEEASPPVIRVKLTNPYDFPIDILDEQYPLHFYIFYTNENGKVTSMPLKYTASKHLIPARQSIEIKWQLPGMQPGKYKVKIVFASPDHPPGMQSESIEITYR